MEYALIFVIAFISAAIPLSIAGSYLSDYFANIQNLVIFMVAMELAINRPEKLITPTGHLSLTSNQLYEHIYLTVTHKLAI